MDSNRRVRQPRRPVAEHGLEVASSVLEAILDHARASAPDECCGLLIGDGTALREARRARNCSPDSHRRYRVEPADHFAAVRAARAAGLEVMGAYHSHPGSSAEPSSTDRAEAHDAEWLHVIAAPDVGAVRAWRLVDGNFHEVPLVPCG